MEKEIGRGRDRQRQTDRRPTDRETGSQTETRQTDRQTETERGRKRSSECATERQSDRQTRTELLRVADTLTSTKSCWVPDGDAVRFLREVDIPVISNNLCSYYLGYQAGITSKQLCAGFTQGGKDSCQVWPQ